MATALVVPVKFKIGSTTYTPTVTHASLVSAFALVNQYYNEISYGSFPGWTVTVYPSGSSPLNIPGTILASDLTSAGLKNAADPLVAGFTPSSFDVVVYIVAQGVEGLWGHQGWTVAVPGQRCYVSESDFVAAPDGHVRPSVTCHELGHIQGLNHCHGWHCNSTAAFCQPPADVLEYVSGDLMGDAGGGQIYTSHPNVVEKWELGYLTLGTDVPQFTASGGSRVDTTFVLDAIENPSPAGARGVHINLATSVLKDTTFGTGFIDRIWLECRDPLAFSPYFEGPFQSPLNPPDQNYAANLSGGVLMHLAEAAHPENGTWRIDGDAGRVVLPDFDMLDSVLKPGQQRVLASSHLWIQCLAWDAANSRATIRIWYDPSDTPPPTPDTIAPSTPTGLAASSPNTTTVRLSWTASTDAVGVTAYKVWRDGSLIHTTGNVTAYSDTTVVAATTYSYQVSALDAALNESAKSSAASITTGSGGVGGGTDPVFTAGIADGSRTNSTTETFSWAAAAGATWWTQLDNDAWVNQGSATSLTLSNLHGATRHRFRLMSVTAGVASRIAHREWDVVGPYSRVKFSVGSESCLVIPVQYGGNPPFVGTAPNTNPDVIKVLFIPCDRVTNKLPGTAADWQVHLDECAAMHRQASWNQITIQWTQAPKVTIADPPLNTFDQSVDRYNVLKALTALQFDYTGYDMLCYGMADPSPADAISPAEIFIEGLALGSNTDSFVATHEMGHGLGMTHSGAITTYPYSGKASVDAQPQPPSVTSEYACPYSVMGEYGYRNGSNLVYALMVQPLMFNKWLAGWCRGSQIQQVTAGGAFQLNGRENVNPTLPQALVMASSEGLEYWVEFVKPGTTQTTDSLLKTASPALAQPCVLIYVRATYPGQPYTQAGIYDHHTYMVYPDLLVQAQATGFVQGDTFTDHGLKITVGAITSTTATVTIANPVAPSMLPLQSMARPGQIHDLAMSGDSTKAVLTWSNPVVTNEPITIYRDGRFKAAVNSGATTYTDTTVAGVAHDYWVVAQHAQAAGVSGHIQSAPSNMVTWTPSFTGPRSPTGTPADWQSQLDTINAYYQENSWGQFSFNFTLAPIVSVPAPTPTVPATDPAYFNQVYPPMMTAADAAALAAGYDRSQYQHVYYMPPDIGDNMIGADFVVQNPSLTQPLVCLVPNGLDPTYIYGLNASTHEFGHSLGFSHANALDAGTVTLSPTALTSAEANPTGAANVEYGNPTSTMGRGQAPVPVNSSGVPFTDDGRVYLGCSYHNTSSDCPVMPDVATAQAWARLVTLPKVKVSQMGGFEAQMLTANPNLRLLRYGKSVQYSLTNEASVPLPESWHAHTGAALTSGTRVTMTGGSVYVMDPNVIDPQTVGGTLYQGWTDYQSANLWDTTEPLVPQYAGAYMDSLSQTSYPTGTEPWKPGAGRIYTWTEWLNGLWTMLDTLRAAHTNLTFDANAAHKQLWWYGTTRPVAGWQYHADLVQIENWLREPADLQGSVYVDADWVNSIQMCIDIQAGGATADCKFQLKGSDFDTAGYARHRMFGLASSFLANRGNLTLDTVANDVTQLAEPSSALWRANLGTPVQSFPAATSFRLSSSTPVSVASSVKVYARRYASGIALVCTDEASAVTVTLDRSYRDLLTGASVGASVVIQPNSGMVLTT